MHSDYEFWQGCTHPVPDGEVCQTCPRPGDIAKLKEFSAAPLVAEGEEKLLSCPLFGHQPQWDWATRALGPGPYLAVSGAPVAIKFYSIVCPGCCSTASFESREQAIKAWNTRATPSPVDHEKQAREIVRRLAVAIRARGFKGELFEAMESLMDERDEEEDDQALDGFVRVASPVIATALQSAGVDGGETESED